MNTYQTPTVVVKGDLDSVIHGQGEGPGGAAIAICAIVGGAKILLVLSLVGLYWLFIWSTLAGFIVMILIVFLVIFFINQEQIRQESWKAVKETEVKQIPSLPLGTSAGWYVDPLTQKGGRFWNGTKWTMQEGNNLGYAHQYRF